jgi:hypothetical protein
MEGCGPISDKPFAAVHPAPGLNIARAPTKLPHRVESKLAHTFFFFFGFLPPTHSYDTTYMKTSNLSDDNSKSSFFIYFVFRGTYIFFHLTLNKMEVYISLVL